MKQWPTMVAFAMLLIAWGSLRMLSHGEQIPPKKPFAEFPFTIADRWQGRELGLDQASLEVLKLDDYMMRAYKTNDGGAPTGVWLFVSYYQSQRTGSTYHSPKNCLPGSGWQFVDTDQVTIPAPGTKNIQINKILIEKGLDKQVILYWYHDRGRVIASEYWAKGYMIWDAITRHRTDGSLVRVSIPVTTTPEEAYRQGLTFLNDMWPILQEYMPSGDSFA